MAILVFVILDFSIAKATAQPALKIREGPEHLHNNLVAHAVALEDINSDLPFASVRHLYSTHPNSHIHDAGKKIAAAKLEEERNGNQARAAQGEFVSADDVVQHPHKLFLGAFTGVAIRALVGLAALGANKICSLIDMAQGGDKSGGQIAGLAVCYAGANILGVYGLFSAGHNLYKLQQGGTRLQQVSDGANRIFDIVRGAIQGTSKRSVHEIMENEALTHRAAVAMAEMGHIYEAAGIMSTIRPVSLKTRHNQTAHLWQEWHDGQMRKTHVLTRLNAQDSDADAEKRDVCESSNNEAGESPQATICSHGDNEGFTGVYDSFGMFDSENSYEAVDYGMGDANYTDAVGRAAGNLEKLGGTSGVCLYPSVNNKTALTILSALEFGSKPSQTYSNCPSLS